MKTLKRILLWINGECPVCHAELEVEGPFYDVRTFCRACRGRR